MREGRKAAAEGVEIGFDDRLVGSEPSEIDPPQGSSSSIAGTTKIIVRPARLGEGSDGLDWMPCPIFCWWIDVGGPVRVPNPRKGGCAVFRGSVTRYAAVLPILLRRVRCSICWLVPPQTMCGERGICRSNTGEAFSRSAPAGVVLVRALRAAAVGR